MRAAYVSSPGEAHQDGGLVVVDGGCCLVLASAKNEFLISRIESGQLVPISSENTIFPFRCSTAPRENGDKHWPLRMWLSLRH